jgi:transcriptional regulator with XRE-family HTH domain
MTDTTIGSQPRMGLVLTASTTFSQPYNLARSILTLDQVSRAARRRGLKWSESRVADFEAGRVTSPSINTLLAFAIALADAGCDEATLPGLVKYISPMEINESLALWDSDIINLMKGERVKRALSASDVVPDPSDWKTPIRERKILHAFEIRMQVWRRVVKEQGATEIRMSKALGVAPSTLAHVTASLWKRTFSEERDHRAGDGANAQKRGQVSRAMQVELSEAIQEALDGNRK